MNEYKFTYLLLGVLFLIIWTIFFIKRKDLRKEMLFVSFIIAIFGPASNIIYIKDWWKPISIWGPDIAIIESLLTGFGIGGIACVIYEEIFKKKIKPRNNTPKKINNKRFLYLLISTAGLGYFLFFVVGLNSFIAINTALFYGILIILVHRKDLLLESIVSGFLMLLVSIIVYSFLELLTPGWVNAFWYWKNVPQIIILNVPIDDFINYLLIGAWVGIIYEYWQEAKLINIKN